MTRREITSMFIKFMGIFFLIRMIPGMAMTYSSLRFTYALPDSPMSQFLYVVPLLYAIGIIFLIAIIVKSDTIARWFYREDKPIEQLTGLSFHEIQNLGYKFIGIFLIVQAIPEIVNILISFTLIEMVYVRVYLPQMVALVVQIILGLELFLWPHGPIRNKYLSWKNQKNEVRKESA